MLGVVALGLAVSLAAAQSGGPETHPTFDDDESRAALAREAERAREREEQRGTAAERERRVEAAVAYRDMGEAEALALARDTFPQTITAPVWKPLRLRAGEDVEAFLSDSAARVREPGGRLALVESTLPLRSTMGTGQPERVDLGLARVDGQWRPANPLIRLEIASEARRAVSFPGLGFAAGLEPPDNEIPQDRPSESSTLADDRVFYANAAGIRDTDALVTPTPTGAELGLQVRSAASPEAFSLAFDLASGRRLRPASDGSAEVVELEGPGDERPLAQIAPPRAVDADGFAVPASYQVEDGRLTLMVSHRGPEVLHPVFVESSVGSYYLGGASDETGHVDNLADWSYYTNAADRLASSDSGSDANGLSVATQPGDYSPGDYGEWLWSAPRRSFIERVDFDASHAPANSCAVEGIWDGAAPGAWDRGSWSSTADAAGASPWYTGAGTGEENADACASLDWDYKAHCVGEHDAATDTFASCVPGAPTGDPTGNSANSAVFGMVMTGRVADGYRASASMHAATRWLYDRDVPEITELTHTGLPSGWTDSAAITTKVTAREPDPGLGVKRLELVLPNGTETRTHACTGARGSRCPASWALPDAATETPAFAYDTDDMPEGANTLRVVAYDALDKFGERASVAEWAVKVDRSEPDLALGGELWQLAGRDVGAGSYSLDVDATDRHSGVKSVEIFVDGASVFSESRAACADGGCGLRRTWAFDTADFGAGAHMVKLVATDHAGHERLRDFTVALDGAPPSLEVERSSLSNERWVASFSDTLKVAAEDAGTGVAELEVRAGDAAPMVFADSCHAADPNRCPRALEHDFTLDLPNGATEVQVIARDGAENESAPETFTVRVDTEDPTLEHLDTSGLGEAGELQGKARLTFSASDSGSGLSGANLLVDGSKASPVRLECETPDCTQATGEVLLRSDELAQGAHRVSVEVEDRAGRTAHSRAVDVDVDGAPINVEPPAIRGWAHAGETLRADDGEWIASGTPRVSRQWQRCEWGGGDCEDIAGETGDSYTVRQADLGKRLRVEVEMTNAYGAATAMSEPRYVPAQAGPEVTIDTHSPAVLPSWVGTWAVATVTAVDRSLEAGTGVESVSLALDGAPVKTATPCGGAVACPEETDFPLALAALEEGTHILEATATGRGGRSSSARRLVTLDSSAPRIALGGPLAGAAGQPVEPGTYELEVATGDDGGWVAQSGVAHVEVLVDNVRVAEHEQECELGSCRLDRSFEVDTSTQGPGRHTVAVVASDSVGNRSAASLEVVNTPDEGEGSAGPPVDDFRAAIAAEQERKERRATPEARAERERSRTQFAQSRAADALELAREGFGGVMKAEVDPLDDHKVVSFLGDYTARVDQGLGEPDALVQSLSPLRTDAGPGDGNRVDLDLVDAGTNALEPATGLVATRFPGDAAGFIGVGSDVRVRLAGRASERSVGQETAGKLFYADAIEGSDTDMVLIPQPAGLELLLQVRTAASPERYELAFDVPGGARLEEATHGFVRVVAEGGGVLATIAPPAAWDADSEPIPVSYEIDGTTLIVDVDHHGRDLLYPLLVDPIIAGNAAWLENNFQWSASPGTDAHGWRWDRDGTFGLAYSGSHGAGVYQWSGGQASNTLTYSDGKWSQYSFPAPGAGAGTDAYVNKAWFSMRHNSPSGQNTCISQGIRHSAPTGAWEQGRYYRDDNSISPGNSEWQTCNSDADSRWHCLPRSPACDQSQYRGIITAAGTPGNAAALQFRMSGTGPRNGSAYAYLGGAQIWLGDKNPPPAPTLNNPKAGQWVRDGETVTTAITATDAGLGVKRLELHQPGANPDISHNCEGGRNYRCPASWRSEPNNSWIRDLSYTVDSGWTEGPVKVGATANDVLGKVSPQTDTTVYVDKTPPSQPSLEHVDQPDPLDGWDGTAAVTASASDGGSGVERLELLDGDQVIATQNYTCSGSLGNSCPQSESHAFTYSGAATPPAGAVQLAEGVRTLSVRAIDKTGHVSARSTSWEVRVDRTAPTLTLSGSLAALDGGMTVGGLHSLDVHAASTIGVTELSATLDGEALPGPVPRAPIENCQGAECDMSHTFELNLDELPAGEHELVVRAVDRIGNVRTRVITFTLDRSGPDLTLSGALAGWWVSEQPQQLSVEASDGRRVQSLTLEVDGVPVTSPSFACDPLTPCELITHQFDLVPAQYSAGAHTLRLVATDSLGNRSEEEWSVWFAVDGRPFNTTPPSVTGRAHYGDTLTAVDGDWYPVTAMTAAYQWQRCDDSESACEDIVGATGPTYTVGADDLGKRVRVEVAMSNGVGTETATSRGRAVPLEDVPELSLESSSPAWFAGWVGPQPLEATVAAQDPGVDDGSGIDAVSLTLDGHPVTPTAPCVATIGFGACAPETVFPLDTSGLAEGTHTLEASATNTVGTTETVSHIVELDATPPTVALSGSLVDAAATGLAPGKYALDISATDSGAGTPQSGVTTVAVLVDGEEAVSYQQPCELGGCPLQQTFTFDTARWGAGSHEVEVIASDQVDNQARQVIAVRAGCQAAAPTRPEPVEKATPEEAVQALEAHPAVIAPSELVIVDGESYRPTLSDEGSILTASGSAARVEIPEDPTASVVLGSGVTTSCLTPTAVGKGAEAAEEPVNGDSALHMNTGAATDTVIRPVVEGLETFTSIRSASAPEAFSWQLTAGDAQLEPREDGRVELVDQTPPRFDIPGETVPIDEPRQLEGAQATGEVVADAQLADPAAAAEAAQAPVEAGVVLEASAEEAAAAEDAPPAPTGEEEPGSDPGVSFEEATQPAEAELDEALEDEAQAELAVANTAGAATAATLTEAAAVAADEELEPLVLAEVAEPESLDANRQAVPTSLSVDGETVTLNVDHRTDSGAAPAYPIAADPWFTEIRNEKRFGYREVYSSRTPLLRWKKKWRYLYTGPAAHWISVLPSTRRPDGLYEVRHGGKTYLMAKKTWDPIYVLVKTPVYGNPVKVFSHYQKYEYWARAAVDVVVPDNYKGIAKTARHTHVNRKNFDMYLTFNEENDPCGGAGCKIKENLVDLIKHTPGRNEHGVCQNEEIHVAAFKLAYEAINNALTTAIKNCVRVYIIHNGRRESIATLGGEGRETLYAALVKAAEDAGKPIGHYYRRCPKGVQDEGGDPRGGCMSNTQNSIMHSKYVLFSKTSPRENGPKKRAVWFGSANMTTAKEEGENTRSDNTVLVLGNGEFYEKFRRKIWEPMWDREGYDDGERKFTVGGTTKRPAFTVEASPIPADDADPFAAALKEIENPRKCEIRVIERSWKSGTRKDVARALHDLGDRGNLSEKGCSLHVMTSQEASPLSNNDFAMDKLCEADAPLRELFEVRGVHDKVVMAKWMEGSEQRHMVLTGSHNLSLAARKENDEVLVTIRDDADTYNAFKLHWGRAVASHPEEHVDKISCRNR